MAVGKKSAIRRFRDSVTGLFVSRADAERRPDTTYGFIPAPGMSRETIHQLRKAITEGDERYGRGDVRTAYIGLSRRVMDLIRLNTPVSERGRGFSTIGE